MAAVRIVRLPQLREWARTHADAAPSLARWEGIVNRANWTRWTEVRASFGAGVDRIPAEPNDFFVFDIHGGNYRLIAGVIYSRESHGRRLQGSVFLKHFFTHAQYDNWSP